MKQDRANHTTSMWQPWVGPALNAIIAFAVFVPSVTHELVNWDDDRIFDNNVMFRGWTGERLHWMWTTMHMGHYQPLTWMSLALDYALWGEDSHGRLIPTGFFLTNCILHAFNTALVTLLFVQVANHFKLADTVVCGVATPFLRTVILASAALIWSLHPLRVESVVWATERRDLLSTFFLLVALSCYLRDQSNHFRDITGTRVYYWISVTAYTASLLSKALGMTLPAVLMILDACMLCTLDSNRTQHGSSSRISSWRSLLIEKIPFMVLSATSMFVAVLAQQDSGAWKSVYQHSPTSRITQALYGIGWYPIATLYPANLCALYPIPDDFPHSPSDLPYTIAFGAIILALSSLSLVCRRYRVLGIAWVLYLCMVSPMLGLAQSGPQLVADRYSYLSTLPWYFAFGVAVFAFWSLATLSNSDPARRRVIIVSTSACLAGVVLLLAILTSRQSSFWSDGRTLWSHAVACTPWNPIAHNQLALAFVQDGNLDLARLHASEAVRQQPLYTDAQFNLGGICLRQGDAGAAVVAFDQVLMRQPKSILAFKQRAVAHQRLGQTDAALNDYDSALQIDSADSDIYWNRMLLHLNLSQSERAAQDWEMYQRLGGACDRETAAIINAAIQKGRSP